MAPKYTKCTANIASKRPCQVTHLETELKVIKCYKGRKLVMVIVSQVCSISPFEEQKKSDESY